MSAPEPRIAFSDEHLAVIDKPAGLLVHPAPGSPAPSLVEALGEMLGGGADPERPGIVHRLDLDTSGLLVVARGPRAHAGLSELVATRRMKREYLALVEGCPPSRTGTVDAALGRDRRAPERVVVGGRKPRAAVTHFTVRERFAHDALLEVRLETGRTHQIRVHLQAIGHPVCGDPRYGTAGRHGLERQFLHSHRLSFRHPVTGAEIEVESPLPGDLEAALALARAA